VRQTEVPRVVLYSV